MIQNDCLCMSVWSNLMAKRKRKAKTGQPLFHGLESIEREAAFKTKTPKKNCYKLIHLKCIAFSSFSRQSSSLSLNNWLFCICRESELFIFTACTADATPTHVACTSGWSKRVNQMYSIIGGCDSLSRTL